MKKIFLTTILGISGFIFLPANVFALSDDPLSEIITTTTVTTIATSTITTDGTITTVTPTASSTITTSTTTIVTPIPPKETNTTIAATATTTIQKKFTTCSQKAIEKRDGSITTSRNLYNDSMAIAMTARKEAEVSAVEIDNEDEKAAVIEDAVDAYKKAVKEAQDNLTKGRNDAWSTFEVDNKSCKYIKSTSTIKPTPKTRVVIENKDPPTSPTTETDGKSLGENIIDAIKDFFKK